MAIAQMICFVTPGAPAQVPPSVTRRIDGMCTDIGRIHFATLALLPPAPQAPHGADASLMLEIVVDEDLLLPDLVDLMLEGAFAALWQLYKPNWQGPEGVDPGTRKTWLRAFLIRYACVADGGFVGARDRSVAQVQAENSLFRAARSHVQSLPPAERPRDARALGEHMARWARESGFAWVADPAPRSRWRKGPDFGLIDLLALSTRLVVPLLAALGFLYALGWAMLLSAGTLHALGVNLPRELSGAVMLASITILLALLPLLGALLTGGGIVALGTLFFVYSAVAVWIMVAGTYNAVGAASLLWPSCSVNQGLLGLSGVLAFAASAAFLALAPVLIKVRAPPFFPMAAVGALMLVALGLGWVFSRLMFGAMEAHVPCKPQSWTLLKDAAPLVRLAWDGAALASVLGVCSFILIFATRWAPALLRQADKLGRPGPLPPLPAHQVHPSIQACEARLTDRTSHMISLTEIRRPYFLYRNVLRFWLWFFSVLGHYVFTEGVLGRAHGIKFGHWHIVDRGRRLLFCSNFDSAFGGYLDEFIQGATEGVNLIWRNSELLPRPAAREGQPSVETERHFPPTCLGLYRGCKAEQVFKAYTRASMLPHLHRFEAYCLSNQDIERATGLREALRGTRTALKDDQIARALES
ncbi:MAG: hypothetical protein JSS56_08275 [Proteobacteria bacterium]|nr:hypothetical protein [Pseudomonadota bacterium]